jgi:hypothetical protein
VPTPVPRQVDGEGGGWDGRTHGVPVTTTPGEAVQEEDQRVASAMRASRSLSRSIKA